MKQLEDDAMPITCRGCICNFLIRETVCLHLICCTEKTGELPNHSHSGTLLEKP